MLTRTTPQIPGSSADIAPRQPHTSPEPRPHRRARPQLLTREQLDGRTNAAKLFDRIARDITNDLGGRPLLSTIELSLVEAFAGAAVNLQHLNAKLVLGQQIDLAQHAQIISALVRLASRLGCQRRAKDISPPTLSAYLRSKTNGDDADDDEELA